MSTHIAEAKTQTVHYDAQTDVLYLSVKTGETERTEEVAAGITVEFSEIGELLGVEILRASHTIETKVLTSILAKQSGII